MPINWNEPGTPAVQLDAYDTKLPPEKEQEFQSWKQRYAPQDSGQDYDLRGAFNAGLTPGADGHWPDTYKKPNHPTFSDQSIYAPMAPEKAGKWLGNVYVPPNTTPSLEALIQEDPNNPIAMGGVPMNYGGFEDRSGKSISLSEIFLGSAEQRAKYKEHQQSLMEAGTNPETGIPWDTMMGGEFGVNPYTIPGQVVDVVKGLAKLPTTLIQAPGAALEELGRIAPASQLSMNVGPIGPMMLATASTARKVTDTIDAIPSSGSMVAEAAGQSAGFLGLGAWGVKALGASPGWLTAALGSASEAPSMYNEANAMGATPEEAGIALLGGSLLGLTEAVEGRWFLDRANKATRGALMEFIKKNNYFSDVPSWVQGEALKGFLVEGFQEGAQTFGENLIAKDLAGYDPNRSLNENVAASILSGGTVGSVMGWGIGKLRNMNAQELQDEYLRHVADLTALGGINAIEPGVPFTPLQDYVFLKQEKLAIEQALAQAGEGPLVDMEGKVISAFDKVPSLKDQLTPDKMMETTIAARTTGYEMNPVDLSTPAGTPTLLPVQDQLPKLDEVDWNEAGIFKDYLETTAADAKVHPEHVVTDETGTGTVSLLDALKTSDVVFAEVDPYADQIAAFEAGAVQQKSRLDKLKENSDKMDQALFKRAKRLYEKDLIETRKMVTELKEKTRLTRQIAGEVTKYIGALRTAFGEGTKFVVTDGSFLKGSPIFGHQTEVGTAAGAIYPAVNNIPLSDDGSVTGSAAIMFLKLDDMATRLWESKKLQKEMLSALKSSGADKGMLKAKRKEYKKLPWFQNNVGRELFAAVTHEVGHSLITRHLKGLINKAKAGDRASAGIFFSLLNEYESWLKVAAGTPMDFFSQTVSSAIQLTGAVGKAASNQASLLDTIGDKTKAAKYAQYLYSFDEFFAERTAKMVSSVDSTIADLIPETKFYNEVAASFKKYFSQLPENIQRMYDSNWMSYLRAQGLGAKMEELQGGKPTSLIDIIKGNSTAIGFSPDEFAGLQAAMDKWTWIQNTGQTLLQNAKDNPHVAPLQAYVGLTTQWAAFVRNLTAPTNDIIKAINKLGKGSSAKVSEILFEEAHSKKRLPTETLSARLDEQEQQVYTSVRGELDKILAMMKEITIADAKMVFAENTEALTERLEEIETEFKKMQRAAYFPFMRFGKWTFYAKAKKDVTFDGEDVKAGETLTFQTFESEKERDAAMEDVRMALKDDVTYSKGIMSDTEFSIQGMPRSMLLALRNSMKGEDATPEQIAIIDRAIESTTPFQSFKKQWVRKKGIHGHSEDMLRSFSSYMRMAAGHMARVQFAPQLFEQVRQMDGNMQIMREVGEPTQKRQQMRDWMGRHFSYIMNPTNEWTALRGAISVAYLGLNIKSAVLQLVQIPQVVYPYLAARYGDLATVAALTKAPWTLRDYVMNSLDFKDSLDSKLREKLKGTTVVDQAGSPLRLYRLPIVSPEGPVFVDGPPPPEAVEGFYLNAKKLATADTLQLPEVAEELEMGDVTPGSVKAILQKLGYDGIIYPNADTGTTSVTVFSEDQVVPGGAIGEISEKNRVGMMLAQGLSEQWLDQSYATELALASSENNLDRGLAMGSYLKSKSKRMWHASTRLMMLPFHVTEKANRYVTAIAAYKLHFEQTGDHHASISAAREANWSANFEYARWNRPEFARGKKSVALMFSSFWQNSLYFATKDAGATRYWLMMLYMAGLMGLPFADDIEDLLSGVLTYFKEKLGYANTYTDLDMEAREFLKELGAPSTTADYLLHGVSNDSFGAGLLDELFGVPIPRLDMSGSVGMGDIIPGTELLQRQLSARGMPNAGGNLIAGAAEAAAGAAGSMASDLVSAAVSGNVDDWKTAEKLIPFVFARNISKAGRMMQEGGEMSRAGEPISQFDMDNPRDIAEMVAQGLGFTPRKTSLGWEEYMATKNLIRYYESQKRILQSQLNQSFMQEDREARADMLHKIGEFNRSVPYPEFMIQDPGKGVEQYLQRQTEAGVIGISDKRYIRIKKQMEATFGTGPKVPPMRTEDNQPISPL